MSIREKGVVRMYDADRGFGFVRPDRIGDDLFLHLSAFAANVHTLTPGERISFTRAMGRKGEQAVSIELENSVAVLSGNAAE